MFTLSIPTYNRFEMAFDLYSACCNYNIISEIAIHDDGSNDYELLCNYSHLPKLSLGKIDTNSGAFYNKYKTIELSSNKWCMLIDSDNFIDDDFISVASKLDLKDDTIYAPCWGSETFDYTFFSDLVISKENIHEYIDTPLFKTLLNTGNYIVPRCNYLKVAEQKDNDFNPLACDVIYFNYLWLKNGFKIKVVDGLKYTHTVHENSYFLQNAQQSFAANDIIINKIKSL